MGHPVRLPAHKSMPTTPLPGPPENQTPQRDLSVTTITPLGEIGFEDWTAFGVKAANVAVLGMLGFPTGTVPTGFAIPFYFYDKFMTDSGLYDDIKDMLAASDFQTDFDTQESELKKLRKAIKDAETPQWIIDALTAMHATYPRRAIPALPVQHQQRGSARVQRRGAVRLQDPASRRDR